MANGSNKISLLFCGKIDINGTIWRIKDFDREDGVLIVFSLVSIESQADLWLISVKYSYAHETAMNIGRIFWKLDKAAHENPHVLNRPSVNG